MSIQRCPKDKKHPYAVISKNIIFDKKLKPTAKVLLIALLSLPDDWKIFPKEIATRMGMHANTIYTALKDLEQAGYCQIQKKTNAKGHRETCEYFISEIPRKKPLVTKSQVREFVTILSNEAPEASKEKQQQARARQEKPKPSAAAFSREKEEDLKNLKGSSSPFVKRILKAYTPEQIAQGLAAIKLRKPDNPCAFLTDYLKAPYEVKPTKPKGTAFDAEKFVDSLNSDVPYKFHAQLEGEEVLFLLIPQDDSGILNLKKISVEDLSLNKSLQDDIIYTYKSLKL